jgi:hypothetical protein
MTTITSEILLVGGIARLTEDHWQNRSLLRKRESRGLGVILIIPPLQTSPSLPVLAFSSSGTAEQSFEKSLETFRNDRESIRRARATRPKPQEKRLRGFPRSLSVLLFSFESCLVVL